MKYVEAKKKYNSKLKNDINKQEEEEDPEIIRKKDKLLGIKEKLLNKNKYHNEQVAKQIDKYKDKDFTYI
jgi:hypothetical protein